MLPFLPPRLLCSHIHWPGTSFSDRWPVYTNWLSHSVFLVVQWLFHGSISFLVAKDLYISCPSRRHRWISASVSELLTSDLPNLLGSGQTGQITAHKSGSILTLSRFFHTNWMTMAPSRSSAPLEGCSSPPSLCDQNSSGVNLPFQLALTFSMKPPRTKITLFPSPAVSDKGSVMHLCA